MIKLKLHSCYRPIIKIFDRECEDKNNKVYYKGYYQDQELHKIGFIVREPFFKDWSNCEIAEIDLEITEKGCTIINYFTFEYFKIQEKHIFIQIFGVYLDGRFAMINPYTNASEIIIFVPSLPNRFSFDERPSGISHLGFEGHFRFEHNFKLRLIKQLEVKGIVEDLYGDVLDSESFNDFSESIKEFIIITKDDSYEWEEEDMDGIYYCDGNETYNIVFGSVQEFINS